MYNKPTVVYARAPEWVKWMHCLLCKGRVLDPSTCKQRSERDVNEIYRIMKAGDELSTALLLAKREKQEALKPG